MKLWSSRFEQDISNETLEYTHTVDIDQRLICSELWSSISHVMMLRHQNLINTDDSKTILKVLLEMHDQATNGTLQLRKEFEDVHLNIESSLIDDIGMRIGGKLHTARSRNDQVVTDSTYVHQRRKYYRFARKLLNLLRILQI